MTENTAPEQAQPYKEDTSDGTTAPRPDLEPADDTPAEADDDTGAESGPDEDAPDVTE